MKCPVGHPGEIPDDALSCQICGVDLSSLQRVRQLHIAEFNEAARLAEFGAIDLALNHAMASLSWDNHYVPAITLVGKLLWQKKRFHEAIERWSQAASLSPEDKDIKNLIEDGRVYLKRRRLLHIFYASAATIIVGVAFVFLPLYALTNADKRISALSTAVSDINDQASSLWENQANISGRFENQMDEVSNFEVSIDELRNEFNAETLKLAEKSQVFSEEQAVILSRIESQAKVFLNIEANIEEFQNEFKAQISMLNEKVGVLRDEQDTISAGMKSNIDDIGILAETVRNLERKLINQASNLEASFSRHHLAIAEIVEDLRPPHMNELEEKIIQTRKDLTEIKTLEESLRNSSDLTDMMKHLRARRDLREYNEKLQILKNEWEKYIVPWIRVKENMEPVWETGNSER